MSTRSGVSYHPPPSQMSEPMENLQAQIKALADQMTQMATQITTQMTTQLTQSATQTNNRIDHLAKRFDQLGGRVGTIARTHGSQSEPDPESPQPRRTPGRNQPRAS